MKKLLICMLVGTALMADCSKVVEDCKLLVEAQDTQIEHQNEAIKQLEEKNLEGAGSPLIPWYVYLLVGFGAGVALTR